MRAARVTPLPMPVPAPSTLRSSSPLYSLLSPFPSPSLLISTQASLSSPGSCCGEASFSRKRSRTSSRLAKAVLSKQYSRSARSNLCASVRLEVNAYETKVLPFSFSVVGAALSVTLSTSSSLSAARQKKHVACLSLCMRALLMSMPGKFTLASLPGWELTAMRMVSCPDMETRTMEWLLSPP